MTAVISSADVGPPLETDTTLERKQLDRIKINVNYNAQVIIPEIIIDFCAEDY